jgi:hypothetical protein
MQDILQYILKALVPTSHQISNSYCVNAIKVYYFVSGTHTTHLRKECDSVQYILNSYMASHLQFTSGSFVIQITL